MQIHSLLVLEVSRPKSVLLGYQSRGQQGWFCLEVRKGKLVPLIFFFLFGFWWSLVCPSVRERLASSSADRLLGLLLVRVLVTTCRPTSVLPPHDPHSNHICKAPFAM